MKDMLLLLISNPIMIYSKKGILDKLKPLYDNKKLVTTSIWHKKGIGRHLVTINSKEFIVLKSSISQDYFCHDIKYGNMAPTKFAHIHSRNQWFGIKLVEANIQIPVPWRHIIEYIIEMYIYNPPQDGALLYNQLFV